MAELRNVSGLSDLLPTLRGLPKSLQRSQMAKAVGAGTEVVRQQAHDSAPVYHGKVQDGHPPPGTLRNAIQRKFLGHSGTRTQWIVFVRSGKKFRQSKVRVQAMGPLLPGSRRAKWTEIQNQDAYYWRWVEFGTAHMGPAYFMSDALPKTADRAIDAIRQQLVAGLPEAVKKAKEQGR